MAGMLIGQSRRFKGTSRTGTKVSNKNTVKSVKLREYRRSIYTLTRHAHDRAHELRRRMLSDSSLVHRLEHVVSNSDHGKRHENRDSADGYSRPHHPAHSLWYERVWVRDCTNLKY